MKMTLVLTILILSLVALYIWWQWPDEKLHVVMCDVGQGDAMLVIKGFQQTLIDAGKGNAVLGCLQEFLPFWDRHIEVVIITHDDADHAHGMISVFEYYSIGALFRNSPVEPTELSAELDKLIDNYQIKRQYLSQGQKISLKNEKQDVEFYAIWPDQSYLKNKEKTETKQNTNRREVSSFDINDNNLSISGYIVYGELEIITTGDIDDQVEQALIASNMTKDIDIIKIAHHGSKYSNSTAFIGKTAPETALIGVGQKNSFGHPATRVIDLLRYSNINTYLTSSNGNIEITSDGKSYTILPSR